MLIRRESVQEYANDYRDHIALGQRGLMFAPDHPLPRVFMIVLMLGASAFSNGWVLGWLTDSIMRGLESVITDPALLSVTQWLAAGPLAVVYAIVFIWLGLAAAKFFGARDRTFKKMRRAVRDASLTREERRWLLQATRWTAKRRKKHACWPGPGVITIGVDEATWQPADFIAHEGGWLVRSGPRFIGCGTSLSSLIAGCFCLLATTSLNVPAVDRPAMWLRASCGIVLIVRWMAGAGLLPGGWFDAWLDSGSIRFTGPIRTGVFERNETLVIVLQIGSLTEAVLCHSSGRRVRLVLPMQSVSMIKAAWEQPSAGVSRCGDERAVNSTPSRHTPPRGLGMGTEFARVAAARG